MSTNDRKAVLIIRVSDPRQEREGLSMDNQEMVLKEYATAQGFHIERQFRFQESADYKLRKNFQQMVSFVKKRADVPIIIGYRVDRLTRNYHDHVLLDELRLNHGKELHFVHDRLVIAQRTVGREITEWDTKVYLAKSYLNRLKEDAYMTLAFKLSRGEWPGKAPFGYRNVRIDNRSVIEVQEPQCFAVQKAFSLYASGAFSMEEVRKTVNKEFSLRLSKGNIDHVLRNRFYFGEMLMHGKGYAHVHPVLVAKKEFDKVSWVRASHGKTPYKYAGLDFTYRGLISCEDCGCRVTPERKKRRSRAYNYYHCTQFRGKHGAAWLKEEAIEAQVKKTLAQLKVPEEWAATCVHLAEQCSTRDAEQAASLRKTSLLEVEKLEKRLERLYEDRLDGLISVDEYCKRAAKYRDQLDTLKTKCDKPSLEADQRAHFVKKFLAVCQIAGDSYGAAENAEKRHILKFTFQNISIKGKELLLEPKMPFKEVLQCAETQNWLRLEDMFRHSIGDLDLEALNMILDSRASVDHQTTSSS